MTLFFSDYSADEPVASLVLTRDAPDSAVPLATRIAPEVPELTSDLVSEIGVRSDRAALSSSPQAVSPRSLSPHLQGKELALELERRDDIENLPLRQRNDLRIAVRHLVRAAYLLDWYGDLGNKQQVSGAYDIFDAAVDDIARAYEGTP